MDASEFQLVMKGYDPNPNADIEAYSAGPVKTNRTIVRRQRSHILLRGKLLLYSIL